MTGGGRRAGGMTRPGAHLQREALKRRRQSGELRIEPGGAGTADLRVQLQRPQPHQVPKVRPALRGTPDSLRTVLCTKNEATVC